MKDLLDVIHALYEIELRTAESHDPPISSLPALLERLEARRSDGLMVPQDVVEYLDAGRNPNVYTRQFSEQVTKELQLLHGRMLGYQQFSQLLNDIVEGDVPGSFTV